MEKYPNSGTPPPAENKQVVQRDLGKTVMVALAGGLSALYLMVPLGALDLTDYLPIVGNFDEATAVLVVIASLRYFGLDISKWIDFARNIPREAVEKARPREEKNVTPRESVYR